MTLVFGNGDDVFAGTAGGDTAFGGGGGDSLAGQDGDDLLLGDLPGSGDDSLSGGAGDDTLFGGEGADTLEGGDGDDQLYGEPGGDLIRGGEGADTAFAGDGNDTMNGGNGRDFFIADGGDDLLALGEGDDVGFGGGGGDSLAGGEGNDFLFGDGGADTLRGEAGNDRLHVDGDDAIVDGGAGIFDALVPIAGIAAIDLSNAANQNAGGSGPVVTGMEAVDASIAEGPVAITGAAFGAFGNVLFGSAFDDTIAGSSNADIVLGGGGGDAIAGGGGDDTLIADQGNDTVEGGLGDDQALLIGDPGDWTQSQQGEFTVFANAATGQAVRFRNVQSIFFDGPTQDETVDLDVTDINAAPAASDASFAIAENSANGTAVGTVAATDPDDGDTLAFAFTGGNAFGAFAIDSTTGAITVANSAALDFETTPAFTLTVLATDSGGNTDAATVTIALSDVDESGTNQPPVANDAAFALAENAAAGTQVGTATASDPDAGDTPSFAIAAGNVAGAFAIDAATGAITVANAAAIDFEANPVFSLTVVDTDDAGATDAATITIDLANVNEPPAAADAAFAVAENAPNGTVVGTVAAADPDAGDTRSFAIAGGNAAGAFAIGAASGAITVTDSADLDFETSPTFTLTVAVSDGGGLADTATVTINLSDLNEGSGNAAPTDITLLSSVVPEAAPDAVVGVLLASDPNAGDTFTFALVDALDGAQFAIVGNQLRVGPLGLDAEAGATRNVTVRATDHGGLFFDETFAIAVTNVNEPPVASDASFAVAEHSAAGTLVGTPIAVADPDAGDEASFAIAAGNDLGGFAIDADSGQITVADADALDFGTSPSFTLTVQATDEGGLTDAATVTIDLTDVDETPTNQPPAIEDQGFAVAENLAAGADVGTAAATDPESGALAYAITGGNAGNAFTIDPATGSIETAAALNFEAIASYALTVRVTDDGGLSDSATITIDVTDANEPPVANDQSFAIDENSANGTVVGTATATDPDAGDSIGYAITAGNTGGAFAIDAGTGQITVADSGDLDFETTASFVLTVQATSTGGLTDTASVTIAVNDVDETIDGTGGPDSLDGTAGSDSVSGLGGDDILNGLAGNDTLLGGDGNDTLGGGSGNDSIDGGAGTADLLDLSGATAAVSVTLVQGAGPHGTGDLSGAGLGTDSYADIEGLIGGSFNDTLIGSSLDDTLIGGNGADHLTGQNSDDLVDGGAGADDLEGNSGNDSILGGDGNDTIQGQTDNDTIDGGNGDDEIRGGFDPDTITGGAGSDIFRFVIQEHFGDAIADLDAGTAGGFVDRLRFDLDSEFTTAITIGNGDAAVTFAAGGDAAIGVAGTEIGVKTDAAVADEAAIQALINTYDGIAAGAAFVVFDAGKANAVVYYDADGGGDTNSAVLVADLDSITTLAGLLDFNATDFIFG